MTSTADLAALLRSLDGDTALVAMTALEHKYASREDSESPDSWGYLAYPHVLFGQMLDAAVKAADAERPRMIDLGCGIGTKLLAAERAGCEALGIEHDPRLAEEALKLGATVYEADLADPGTWRGPVSETDIVFCNSPFRDPVLEIAFEAGLADAMKPGAVLMLGNKAGPDPAGWERLTTVIERDGAWKKP